MVHIPLAIPPFFSFACGTIWGFGIYLFSHFFNGQLTFLAPPADLAKNRTVSEDENGEWKNIHHHHAEGSVRNLVSLGRKRIKSDALLIPIEKSNSNRIQLCVRFIQFSRFQI
jgi:hypothetical protein